MSVPDITGLTLDELQALITAATQALYQRQADVKTEKEQRRERAGQSVAGLAALLGPEDSAPYDPATGANATINGVLKHDTDEHEVLEANVGLCLSLILHGMKADVAAGLNLARLAATEG